MRVAVTGATGTIGSAVVSALMARGDQVVALTRDAGRARERLGPEVEAAEWPDPAAAPPPTEALAGCDGVMNLIGEPLDQRWTDASKRRIRESRIPTTRNLVDALGRAEPRPRTLVSQSGSGIYGDRGDERLDEHAETASGDFVADTVAAWEHEARRADELGIRVTIARTGVVLSAGSGALAKMLPPFKLGVGGPVAGGRQYFPWIHLDDEVAALLFALDTDAAAGTLNLAAPGAVTNAELSKALGRVLRRPAVMPVPSFALHALYGEMAEIVVTGARLHPRRLEELGHSFRWTEVEPALRDVLGR
jgi:uncharacterized protein